MPYANISCRMTMCNEWQIMAFTRYFASTCFGRGVAALRQAAPHCTQVHAPAMCAQAVGFIQGGTGTSSRMAFRLAVPVHVLAVHVLAIHVLAVHVLAVHVLAVHVLAVSLQAASKLNWTCCFPWQPWTTGSTCKLFTFTCTGHGHKPRGNPCGHRPVTRRGCALPSTGFWT